ncbi:PAAR domain-containing protein [Frankia sp. CNm7]|uniref:PAAR domain-containing protein n=1 Tax=Frankia nepalensis TaxID=1836974 RepID=A0A937UQ59_9ACTN|nr:PAAR domain-containing protein [Frankia nepalensis]MBL7494828.1 PAAR domain-containing protein [Frankia nepalensis]MBL7508977.1 PAAR domain-containing protein [Frankia nepalensis]MBL7524783.1 PAAR domain-containing protein [Frankia nepalensis]MBL7626311.1 PAAR domain-containing protein [Frankia nepalensis]
MGLPAAKQGDQVVGVDMHVVVPPAPAAPAPMPLPFAGALNGNLSSNVKIMGRPAATVGSTADNAPPHVAPGGVFQRPPSNKGTVKVGSQTVKINGKPAARAGDPVETCNDPTDLPVSKIVAVGTVNIG